MKNYIEEFMKNNGFNKNETYLFKNYFDKDGNMHELNIRFGEGYDITVNNDFASGEVYRQILKGVAIIEKIKPKTLMEQLKEQGYGWSINCMDDINVSKICDTSDLFYPLMTIGDLHLTRNDALRERYRLKLEFEMREWARENDCLCDMRMGARVREDINLWVLHSHLIRCRTKFADK